MSDIQIEISDPEEGGAEAGQTPYGNLWVPLVVVPAAIVIVIVVVFALFGSLTGEEKSLSENLSMVMAGGKNERDQALFGLMRQVSENQRATNDGEELPWPMTADFPQRVREAADQVDAEDHEVRLALGVLLAGLDPSGVDMLVEMLALGDAQDPGGALRFKAIHNLGLVGDGRATESVAAFLKAPDEGLRIVAAGALANLSGDGAREALREALGDPSLDVRGTAAMALTLLDPPDPTAAPILTDLTQVAVYEAVRRESPAKYTRSRDVSSFRIQALGALARLGREADWAHIETLRGDSDANVVDAVLRLLNQRSADETQGSGGGPK
ncbi:MAG TPA: HEAT repeat domain-containing protein [Planctomycetes bacterium]|nr:HEAT repeat domain-containing protein [Planctomycetota bacterium]HIK62345.1 HEAT repeat domain-containing protein [Planctomycetota bacterium]